MTGRASMPVLIPYVRQMERIRDITRYSQPVIGRTQHLGRVVRYRLTLHPRLRLMLIADSPRARQVVPRVTLAYTARLALYHPCPALPVDMMNNGNMVD